MMGFFLLPKNFLVFTNEFTTFFVTLNFSYKNDYVVEVKNHLCKIEIILNVFWEL